MMIPLCFFPFLFKPSAYIELSCRHSPKRLFFWLRWGKIYRKNNLCLLIKLIPKHPGMQVSTPLKQLNNLSVYYYACYLIPLGRVY